MHTCVHTRTHSYKYTHHTYTYTHIHTLICIYTRAHTHISLCCSKPWRHREKKAESILLPTTEQSVLELSSIQDCEKFYGKLSVMFLVEQHKWTPVLSELEEQIDKSIIELLSQPQPDWRCSEEDAQPGPHRGEIEVHSSSLPSSSSTTQQVMCSPLDCFPTGRGSCPGMVTAWWHQPPLWSRIFSILSVVLPCHAAQ